MEENNRQAIRNFMIKSLKRYMNDMLFFQNVVDQNKHAFDAVEDIIKQFDITRSSFKAILDYNFYPEEIENMDKVVE